MVHGPFHLIKINYYTTVFCSIINVSVIFLVILKAPREMRIQSKSIAYAHFSAVLRRLDSWLFLFSTIHEF
ncbi:unnamed protein product, partial [Mesorhabditis belari]|uniref:Uncharacterized protein n=1 Tax=Mesorhabditis belari TaxID=2138241 RepID=A0AAF3ERF5_9BILA